MTHARVKHVIKGSASQGGRCRYCRKRIVWAKVAPHGKSMPFDREPIYAPSTRNPDTGVEFEVWPDDLLHFTTCPRQPERKQKRATSTRALEAGR